MTSGSQRIALAAAVLAGVWVVTYWLWPAGEGKGDPAITFDEPKPAKAPAAPASPPSESPIGRSGAPGSSDAPAHPTGPSRPIADPATSPPDNPPQPEQQGPETARPDSPAGQPPAPALSDPGGAAPQQARGPTLIKPQFTEYVVKPQDTMPTIAQAVYGRRQLWQAIAKANPSVDPMRLKAGQRLRIPVDPNNTQGIVSPGARPVEEPVTEYVVARGDTLTGIAKSLYGRSSLWQVILDANRDKLKNAKDLRPGMRLIIPPAPIGSRADAERERS